MAACLFVCKALVDLKSFVAVKAVWIVVIFARVKKKSDKECVGTKENRTTRILEVEMVLGGLWSEQKSTSTKK